MTDSTTIIILTLSQRLRKMISAFSDENKDWEILGHCLLEWSAQQFVSRNEVKLTAEFFELYQVFLDTFKEQLTKVTLGFNLQKAEWKENELWLHFANRQGKHFPNWNHIGLIKIPDVKDKTIEGVVIFHPKDSNVYYSEVSRMPRHAVVQTEEFLRMGIHSSKVLQTAFDLTPIKRLASRFLSCHYPNQNWDVSKGFSVWWKETRQGFPVVIEERSDDYGPDRKVKSHWKDKYNESRQANNSQSKNNPNYRRRVKAGKNEYANAFKCSQGENIQPKEVYARCYSKRPEWEDWSFI
ncbi:hypothetical protein MOC16_gp367 [Klebsiella phage vB_KpM_FBKp24]|uniref:Uncharacterized protein n=1 Tax=Klebsiella phage vB_KpM_FBKp24 TaxID=2801834 RepID=A0A7U0GBD1_9CAUD|nr:hypothetical protein MOC16_gp367 [Klebsiella phage vB_KpM_FBKp24]QQV92087.1 hypothetical protein vBKpMFBKp24_046 [Klebsiella phage vB_KpM_FBKp24]